MYREFLLKLIRPVGIHAQTFGFDDAVVVDAPHLAPESAGALSVARAQAQLGGDALVSVLVAVLAIEQLKYGDCVSDIKHINTKSMHKLIFSRL